MVIYPCGVFVVGIGGYDWSGKGKRVDLLAAVHYVSRGAVIWDPPKLVKRSLTLRVKNNFCSKMCCVMSGSCGIRTRVFKADLFARPVQLTCGRMLPTMS